MHDPEIFSNTIAALGNTAHLVAFSCQRRGFCVSCGARRMAENLALLVDEVFPQQPVRQWVLSVPYPLRFLAWWQEAGPFDTGG